MNGIEKITAKIEQDAQVEIDAVLAQANAEAAEIAARYASQAAAEAEEILKRGGAAAAERESRLASMAQMEGRKAELAAKQEIIEDAFELALKKLLDLPEDKYVDLLADLAVKASATGKETLIFSGKDRAQVGERVVAAANAKLTGGSLTLSEETRGLNGGFILSNGTVEVNCTFETLVRLQRGALAGQVAKVLFE